MFTTRSGRISPAAKWALGVQAFAVPAILVICQSPAPGAPALYLPLAGSTPAQGIAWARSHDSTLLGPGPLPGSLMIRSPSADLALAAAAEGALLLSLPAPLCGNAAKSRKPAYR
ncbi:hypothetical protein [Novosphingobium sp. JCM 18896]|uniref:hypothetical protein n=1 Tax=Novosphingobium sp. JCM 18896 TaxID=2989731 RepID=UPI00222146BD|nr:hypothetical protein [Novosphingobium sp. JCM 18896]MCW1431123.1 hypothetical protein [Novosphingobium sp. JCM 18896]